MNDEWMNDELTDADLRFLDSWEKLGHSDTADAEYQPEQEGGTIQFDDSEGDGAEGIGDDENGDGEGEIDGDYSGSEHGGSGEEGDEVDESKMDISQVENQERPDHLTSSGDDDSEIPEGEDDLEYDPFDGQDDHEDFEMQEDDLEPWKNDDENFDHEDHDLNQEEINNIDDSIDEHGEFESGEDAQIEEEFGDGERSNTDSEIEDLDEYEREREEHQGEIDVSDGIGLEDEPTEDDLAQDDVDTLNNEQELNAEGKDDFQGDAQKELEDHLDDSNKSDDRKNDDEPKNNSTDEISEHDESITEDKQEGSEELFNDLPDADPRCTNHCEDNPEEETDHEECPHCAERIERERKLWGAIATDKNGDNILPGDKLRVVIPMPFTTLDAILTANVPNLHTDPNRIAQSTAGEINTEVCWLSGRAISKFTGWHMTDDGAIWTFQTGKKIRFAVKIGEPAYQRTGSNDLDGDQLDIEEQIEEFKNELDQLPEQDPDQKSEDDDGPEDDDESSIDSEGSEDDDSEDEEEQDDRLPSRISGTQKKRFENLTERIMKKVGETFGNTLEKIEIGEIEDHGSFVVVSIKIVSRGALFGMGFSMRKYDDDLDNDIGMMND